MRLHCPASTLLSGPSESTCDASNGRWSPANVGQCLRLDSARCRQVSVSDSDQALCSTDEIVVGGGAECNQHAVLSSSQPLRSLQGWQAGCSGLQSRPAHVYAQCCRAASDTFLKSQLDRLRSPLLPSGSFLQHCEWVTNASMGIGVTAAMALCSSDQQIITGGGMCAVNTGLSASHAIVKDGAVSDGWSVKCDGSSSGAISSIGVAGLCCRALQGDRCADSTTVPTADSVSTLNDRLLVPSTVATCTGASDMLLNAGAMCSEGSTLFQQRVFSAYGRWAEYYSCVQHGNATVDSVWAVVPPALLVSRCCSSWSSTTSISSSYCDGAVTAGSGQGLAGVISSSLADTPNAYGARYSLSCPASDTSSSSPYYLKGAEVTECQADGRWSFNGLLGSCVVLDSSLCVDVHNNTPQELIQSSNDMSETLTCPSESGSESSGWVMIAATTSCPPAVMQQHRNPIIVKDLSPSSIASWSASCFDVGSQTAVRPAAMHGICCSARPTSVWSTCAFVQQDLDSSPSEIRCLNPATTNNRCVVPDVTVTQENGIVVKLTSCPTNYALLNNGSAADRHTLIGGAMSISGNHRPQQWRKLVITTSEQHPPIPRSGQDVCCPSTPLCSLESIPPFVDPTDLRQYWPEGSQTSRDVCTLLLSQR
jgi:hypothetical protein